MERKKLCSILNGWAKKNKTCLKFFESDVSDITIEVYPFDPFINKGLINLNDSFYSSVAAEIRKHTGEETHWNNSGTILWVKDYK